MNFLNTLFPLGLPHLYYRWFIYWIRRQSVVRFYRPCRGMSSVYSAVWSYFSNVSFFQQEKQTKSRQWRLVYAAGLILGALLFGIGWGINGVCPGPAIAALGAGNWPLLIALFAMLAGVYVQGRWFSGN